MLSDFFIFDCPFGQKDFKNDVLNDVTCSNVTVIAIMVDK
jgi:hypothetical protein